MNLDYLTTKLLYCEFQKYEVMTRSVVGGQPKKKNTQISVIERQNTPNALFKYLTITSLRRFKINDK